MKKITIIIVLTLISSSVSCQNSLNEKIHKMIELSGSSNNFDLLIDRLIETQKLNNQYLNDVYWIKMKDSFRDSFKTQLFDAVNLIYAKYFDEDDIDQIISFYESPVGKKLIKTMPNILKESMDAGEKLGSKFGLQIYQSVQADMKENFDSIYFGCGEAKTGNFVAEINGIEVTYNRTDKIQTETYNNIISKYRINWLDDCRYTLKLISTNDPNYNIKEQKLITVNIISCNSEGYKYLANQEGVDFILIGELKKTEKN